MTWNEKLTESRPKGVRIIAIALPIVAIGMAVYQLAFTQYLIQDPTGHRITHLGFALTVALLALMLESKRGWRLKLVLLLCNLVIAGYLMILLDELLTYRSAMPFTEDLVVAVLLVVVVFVTSYLIYGKTFPILVLLFIGYLYFGRYLPFPFKVADVPIERIIMWLSASVGTEEGIYGDILGLSANYLFLFIFFGSTLDAFGGTRFVIGLGRWIGSKLSSGPAAVAVIGSSLLGTITGSTVANITITGSFTIPLMKKSGYHPKEAAAIETVSSNGGQIMPPIMGATAFVMAGFAGIAYIQIAVAAIFPALLYYFGVFLYVQLAAKKRHVKSIMDLELVKGRQLLLDAPIFLMPLAVLVFLLAKGFSLPFVGFWGLMTLVAVGLLSSIRKEARLSFKRVLDVLTKGVTTASEMAIVCALIGLVATCIKVSGLGIKLPIVIADISHGYLFIALLIAMVSSILLGMGVPTPAAYMLVAIGAVPALRAMGVPVLQAHLFCFVSAVFSHITPPVAIGALVASQIAGAMYWPTAWEAVKAGSTAFLLPFFIIYAPVIILRPEGGLTPSIAIIVSMLLAIFSMQTFLLNHCIISLTRPERLTFLASLMLCLIGVFSHTTSFLFAGGSLFVVGIAWQLIRYMKLRTAPGSNANQ